LKANTFSNAYFVRKIMFGSLFFWMSIYTLSLLTFLKRITLTVWNLIKAWLLKIEILDQNSHFMQFSHQKAW